MKNKMSFFNGRALFTGIGLSYIIGLTGTSFWISMLLGLILGILIILIVPKNRSKIITNISSFILAILSCSLLVNMGHTLYLDNTPVFIMTIFPAIGAFIISIIKKDALEKVTFYLFIYSMFLFFLKIFCLYPHIEIENLLPLMTTDIKDILLGAISFAVFGTVPIIAIDNMTNKKEAIINYVISMITIITVSFLSVTVLGINEASLYRYPEYVVLKRIKLMNFISNVDNIFNFAIIADLMLTTASGLRGVETNNRFFKYIILAVSIVIITIICDSNLPLIFLYDNLWWILLILLFMLLFPKKCKYKC